MQTVVTSRRPPVVDMKALKEFVNENWDIIKEVAESIVPGKVVRAEVRYWGPHSGGYLIKGLEEEGPQWVYLRITYTTTPGRMRFSERKFYEYDLSLPKLIHLIGAKYPTKRDELLKKAVGYQ